MWLHIRGWYIFHSVKAESIYFFFLLILKRIITFDEKKMNTLNEKIDYRLSTNLPKKCWFVCSNNQNVYFGLDNTVSALVVRTSHLFKVEYAVRTTPGTVYERVILRSITASAPAQSDVCSDTSNLGIERDHVALQSGIGQVQYFKKNMQRNLMLFFT